MASVILSTVNPTVESDVTAAVAIRSKASKRLLIGQGVLAVLFLFAGASKLLTPLDELSKLSPFPGLFLQFIGVCEVMGGLGMFLPGLLRLRRELTPLAAAGLVIIMIGATVSTAAVGDVLPALLPLVVGVLAASVCYGRWQRLPRRA